MIDNKVGGDGSCPPPLNNSWKKLQQQSLYNRECFHLHIEKFLPVSQVSWSSNVRSCEFQCYPHDKVMFVLHIANKRFTHLGVK